MKSRVLHISHAANVAPSTQRRRERGLLAGAGRGEAHLHVCTLAPTDVLAVGAFHRMPERTSDVVLWKRHTGGRALPAGSGFVIVSLALPHRAALVDEDRLALAPEQVLNRCVRGLLSALRSLGVDVVYPGLDLLTHTRRSIGALSFVEMGDPTLFQAVLPVSASLGDGPFLLDRADPEGVIPVSFIGEAETTRLEAIVPAKRDEFAPAAFAGHLARGYTEALGIETQRQGDDLTRALAAEHQGDPPIADHPILEGTAVRATGLLGPVDVWARTDAGRIADLQLRGDFIAPIEAPDALARALRGCPTDPEEIEKMVTAFLDRDRGYLLGLRPADLVDLIRRSATVPP
ncbi:MAG: lipoate protein ligase C-terminal domain-containing protein [Candidatus Binatia bacterium]|nr:lipoate protein ligase C-terminal domain-containing protein [Candidatus Binatia bacterium]